MARCGPRRARAGLSRGTGAGPGYPQQARPGPVTLPGRPRSQRNTETGPSHESALQCESCKCRNVIQSWPACDSSCCSSILNREFGLLSIKDIENELVDAI